ncbi:MAG TPA: N-formylglutamate deformylase [Rhizomicrobium sp.]|jgi:N-formylglutamate deformylase|nr:N-formylglutamate deformylase [Rhizomicrobium sp.]
MSDWLSVRRGEAPLILSFPHTGTFLPPEVEQHLVSPWLARKDTDWGIDRLYDFAADLDATIIRTAISRTVIDVNRDPAGKSLYPGQDTTALCPTATFDGEALYREGLEPGTEEIARRRRLFFDPYHAALGEEIARLRRLHGRIILYDAHAIRSVIPRLFAGTLPHLNIGTDNGRTADGELVRDIETRCGRTNFTFVVNGRFRGGWTTRHYGDPARGVHAIQMEIACRSYMEDPVRVTKNNWPPAVMGDAQVAELRALLKDILTNCIRLAQGIPP